MSDFVISRVVIACEAIGENRFSIEAAARMAAWLNAAVHGIFVQDEALLHLAALPFARHVGPGGGASEEFDESTILHQFEAQADRARAALEAAASAYEVGWSFDVVRGQLSLATLAVGDRDLLVIEAAPRPFAGAFRLDSRWLAEAFQTHRPILLVRNAGKSKDGVVALVQKPGQSAERTIAVAAALALAAERRLTVLLADDGLETASVLENVRRRSEKLAARTNIERVVPAGTSLERIADSGSVLVVDADPTVNDASSLKQLAARTRADILFLR